MTYILTPDEKYVDVSNLKPAAASLLMIDLLYSCAGIGRKKDVYDDDEDARSIYVRTVNIASYLHL